MSDRPDLADVVGARARELLVRSRYRVAVWTSDDDVLVVLHVHESGLPELDRAVRTCSRQDHQGIEIEHNQAGHLGLSTQRKDVMEAHKKRDRL